MTKKFSNRWLVVGGAILLQICIGVIYSWSLFNEPLTEQIGWDKNDVILTFSIAVFVFAFSTIFSGRLQDKIGPKKVAIIGGGLYGGGLILSSTATTIMQLYIYYGIIAGAGVGFACVCPLSTCVKWLPEKKRFITSVVVGAFGLGSLIFKSIIEFLLATQGVSQTFFYIGIIFVTLLLVGAQFLVLPPYDYGSKRKKSSAVTHQYDYSMGQMIKTKSFRFIFQI